VLPNRGFRSNVTEISGGGRYASVEYAATPLLYVAPKTAVWDLARAELVVRFEGGSTGTLSFAPDESAFVAVDDRGAIVRRSTTNGQVEARAAALGADVGAVVFSPDGESVAVGAGGAVVLFDRSLRERGRLAEGGKRVHQLSWSAGGARLATASESSIAGGDVTVWDIASARGLLRVHVPDQYGVAAVALSPNGRLVASAGSDGVAELRTVDGGRVLGTFDLRSKPATLSPRATSLAFTADGGSLLLGLGSGHLVRYDLAAGRYAAFEVKTYLEVQHVREAMGGRALLAWELGGALHVYDARSTTRLADLRPTAGGEWVAHSHAGAVDGSELGREAFVSTVTVGGKQHTEGWELAWDARHGEALIARAMRGEDVPPPLPDGPP
jgi:hypothetical protein